MVRARVRYGDVCVCVWHYGTCFPDSYPCQQPGGIVYRTVLFILLANMFEGADMLHPVGPEEGKGVAGGGRVAEGVAWVRGPHARAHAPVARNKITHVHASTRNTLQG